ncbi:Transcription initiation factor TFIID subunit 4B [Melia azedarach]|uniref:Transcription initiation factor TFIID subunit 4B n=1 Tax=Melia azedarach TaxID=155640 RepID=A0ACC1YRB5_MELAZ|nr:Transcription initiation factor TFIID subunit 4B [Melia azedarach]
MSNKQTIGTQQTSNPMNYSTQMPFGLLLPALLSHLDKDRARQLLTLYGKLKKPEIVQDVFFRNTRDIVGDQIPRLVVNKMQSQMGANQFLLQSPASAQQEHSMMQSVSAGATPFSDTHSFSQLNQKGYNPAADAARVPASSVQVQSGSHGIHARQIPSSTPSTINQQRECSSVYAQGLNKQRQQHLHFPPTSFSMYGSSSGNYHLYIRAKVSPPGSSLKPHPHGAQVRQITHHQSLGSTLSGGASQPMDMMSMPMFERQNSVNDPGKLQGSLVFCFTNNSTLQQNLVPWQAPATKEKSSGTFSLVTYVKLELVDQSTDQQNKLHLPALRGLSAAQVEQGNTIPGTLTDEAFDKQSPRMGFYVSTSILSPNSVFPSTTTQLGPNIPERFSQSLYRICVLQGLDLYSPYVLLVVFQPPRVIASFNKQT